LPGRRIGCMIRVFAHAALVGRRAGHAYIAVQRPRDPKPK
jgi:hypothetical protein